MGRSSGRSSVAAAAYRAGEKLYNERDGLVHDYSRRGGVEHSEIMLPNGAPEAFKERSALWNAVEAAERRKDSQLAREIEIALPNELSPAERIAFVRSYVQENFVSQGMCADFAIHTGHNAESEGLSNPHAHIMLTMRPIENGAFGPKWRKAPAEGNGKAPKKGQERTTGWDDRENVVLWRADLARRINSEMERLGLPDRVSHLSYADQGLDREPSVHLGPAAAAMERRGERSERGSLNREIEERNRAAQQQKEGAREAEREQAPQGQSGDAESAAAAMAALKSEWLRLEGLAAAARREQSALNAEAAALRDRANGIKGAMADAARYSAAKETLEGQLGQAGFFAFRQKRDLRERIRQADQQMQKANEELGFDMGAAAAQASLLESKAQGIEKQAALASSAPISSAQHQALVKYADLAKWAWEAHGFDAVEKAEKALLGKPGLGISQSLERQAAEKGFDLGLRALGVERGSMAREERDRDLGMER